MPVCLFQLCWCIFYLTSFTYGETIVLDALSGKNGPTVGLIYVTGACLVPEQYKQLCQTVQFVFNQPLVVGIPDFYVPVETIYELDAMLPDLLNEMEEHGLPKNSDVFIAGHSLGGAVTAIFAGRHQRDYKSIYPDWVFKGAILNGAYITRNYRNKTTHLLQNYSIPTLSIMGELDSQIARFIEQFYVQLQKANDVAGKPLQLVDNRTVLNYPMIIVDRMNHMQYATGNIPKAVMKTDLQSEMSTEQAQQLTAQYMAGWMALQTDNGDSGQFGFDALYKAVADSQVLANPFTAAYKLEGSYWLKSPCNCDALICHDTPECQAGSPWMDDVIYPDMNEWIPQEIMCGFGDKGNTSIKVGQINTDSFHPTYRLIPFPLHCHYANIWNNCTSPTDSSCILNSSTVTQNTYDETDKLIDWGQKGNSAIEMRHKMRSRQFCYEQANAGYVEEDMEICGKINQYSIDWALRNAPRQTLDRYLNYGEMLVPGPDREAKAGPLWSYSALHREQKCNATTHRFYTSLESYYLYLPTLKNGCQFPSKEECGAHYCKILSPARAMEWVYYEGLRFNLSVANTNITVNTTC